MNQPLTPKEIGILWFNKVWNERDAALIPVLMSDDAKGHLEGGQEIVGYHKFIEFQNAMLAALPDMRVEILETLGDDDDACILWRATANHSGEGFGLTPTGKSVSFRGMTWFRIKDGKIVEGWDSWDQTGLLANLSSPA
ncbi:MAG: ester cyclase [Luteolibacter sp.]